MLPVVKTHQIDLLINSPFEFSGGLNDNRKEYRLPIEVWGL